MLNWAGSMITDGLALGDGLTSGLALTVGLGLAAGSSAEAIVGNKRASSAS